MGRKGVSSFSESILSPSFRAQSLTALFLTALVALLSFSQFFEGVERRMLDLAFQVRGPEPPHPDIVILEIDDTSLLRHGAWPWPRGLHAKLLQTLQAVRPKAVFVDMIFSEPTNVAEDQALASEIEKAENVILPYYFAAPVARNFHTYPKVSPLPAFASKAARLGFVNVFPDPDGHVRQIFLAAEDQGKLSHHTSLATALLSQGSRLDLLRYSATEARLINFPGPYESFQRIPVDLVLDTEGVESGSLLGDLRDRIVLVGLTATGTVDLKPTAFSPLYPGVGIQASILHTLLAGKWITRIPSFLHLASLFLFASVVLAVTLSLPPLRASLYFLSLSAILVGAVEILFQYARLWIPVFSVLTLGTLVFLTTEIALYIRTRFEAELLKRELEVASRIQRNLLPERIPQIPGLDLAAVSVPAREVGGDFYDILPLPDGKWGVCVGDISGKGVPAALYMAKVISEFRRESEAVSPSHVIQKLNDKISREGPDYLFFTIFYLIVDPSTREIVFSNGGHEPLLFFRNGLQTIEFASTQEGVPVGILEDGRYDSRELRPDRGDILLLMSDGIKEARNGKGEEFGTQRIESILKRLAALPAQKIVGSLLHTIQEFSKGAPQHDDMTVVCIKFV